MKLSEITGPPEDEWLKHPLLHRRVGPHNSNPCEPMCIVAGRVNANDIRVDSYELADTRFEIPFPFGTVTTFETEGTALKTFKNFPLIAETVLAGAHQFGKHAKDPYSTAAKPNSKIKSLDGLTPVAVRININVPKVTSLVGINDDLKQVTEMFFNFNKVNVGGIGLILIKGLKYIHQSNDGELIEPFKIIEKYLGKPDEIFECQMELIEAGYKAYAQL